MVRRLLLALALLDLMVSGCHCRRSDLVPPRTNEAQTTQTTQTSDIPMTDLPQSLARSRSARVRYELPPAEEQEALKGALSALLTGDRPRATELAAAARFVLRDLEDGPKDLVVVQEREDAQRGGGLYVVRLATASRLLVQAPHTFHDENTLPIAWTLFLTSRARAFFCNTVHRYKSAQPDETGRHPADVAHATDSLFHAATLGFLAAVPLADVVQIHGFENGATAGEGVAAVVSSGERKTGVPHAVHAHDALATAIGTVLTFPDDTRELGATTNVQGIATRRSGGRFLHMELAAAIRSRSKTDGALRGRIADAVIGALETQ